MMEARVSGEARDVVGDEVGKSSRTVEHAKSMQSRQLWNTGPLCMCAVGCRKVADAGGVPCRLSLSRLFIYLLTYLR